MTTAKSGKNKLDLRSVPSKAVVVADLKTQLARAQKQLKQKAALDDMEAVKRLQVIIANLTATIDRNS